jgi:hypothetical protein
VNAALAVPEENAKAVLPQLQSLISVKLNCIQIDAVGGQYVYPLLAQRRPGFKAAASGQVTLPTGLAQGLAK